MIKINNESDNITVENEGKTIKPMLVTDDYITVEVMASCIGNLEHNTYPDKLVLAIPYKDEKNCRWINIIKSDIGYNVDYLVRCDIPRSFMFEINMDNTMNYLERSFEPLGITVNVMQPNVLNPIRIFVFSRNIDKTQKLGKELEIFVEECKFMQQESSKALGGCGVF